MWEQRWWTDLTRPAQSAAPAQSAVSPKDPGAIWQSVGKPVTGIGAGKYKLTAHYLFFEKGALRTDAQQVPISGVLDVDVIQSMTQKARGVGNIRVHTARSARRVSLGMPSGSILNGQLSVRHGGESSGRQCWSPSLRCP